MRPPKELSLQGMFSTDSYSTVQGSINYVHLNSKVDSNSQGMKSVPNLHQIVNTNGSSFMSIVVEPCSAKIVTACMFLK